jgi:protein ImuA
VPPLATPLRPLAALRAHLAAFAPPARHGLWRFGDDRVDRCLPGGGLPLGALHEVAAEGIEAETGAAAAGFLACLLAGLAPRGEVVWIAPATDLHPPGLLPYGLDPACLIQIETRNDDATLAALESVLRAGIVAAAVGESGRLGRVAARRLQLACLRHGSTGFVLRRWPFGRRPATEDAHAAVTAWRIAPAPSAAEAGTPGPARWRVALLHARGGHEGAWIMQAPGGPHAPHPLRVVAELADPAPERILRRAG